VYKKLQALNTSLNEEWDRQERIRKALMEKINTGDPGGRCAKSLRKNIAQQEENIANLTKSLQDLKQKNRDLRDQMQKEKFWHIQPEAAIPTMPDENHIPSKLFIGQKCSGFYDYRGPRSFMAPKNAIESSNDSLVVSENTSDNASIISTEEDSSPVTERIYWLQNDIVSLQVLNKLLNKHCYQKKSENNELHIKLNITMSRDLRDHSVQQLALIQKLEKIVEQETNENKHLIHIKKCWENTEEKIPTVQKQDLQINLSANHLSLWSWRDPAGDIRPKFSLKG
jgi:hypothetical protein